MILFIIWIIFIVILSAIAGFFLVITLQEQEEKIVPTISLLCSSVFASALTVAFIFKYLPS